MKDEQKTILIDGHIEIKGITHDKFHNEFIKWIEKKGWSFCGITTELSDDENE